jgi:uncharacterized protein (TIGR03083 family)
MVQATREVPVATIARIDDAEAERLYAELTASMTGLLSDLSPEEWGKPTECELWRVRDMIAHLTGWSEAIASTRELVHQTFGSVMRRGEFGNVIDAQNQVQVDDRSSLSVDELLQRFTTAAPLGAARRRKISKAVGWLPVFVPYLGGRIDLRYVTNVILTRDIYMHRIDISRATGRPYRAGAADQRVFDDIVRDWFERSKAAARLVIEGEIRGTYVSEATPTATLKADGVEWTRMLFQRTGREIVTIEGDAAAANGWLDTFFPL